MSGADRAKGLVGLRRQLVWMLVITGVAILVPFGVVFWVHQHRDNQFHALNEWNARTQRACHDAILSVDELMLTQLSRAVPAGLIEPSGAQREDFSLYNRVLFYLDRIPKAAAATRSLEQAANAPEHAVILGRLNKITAEIIVLRDQVPPAPIGLSQNLLRTLHDTLEQLRLLRQQEYEAIHLQYHRAQERQMQIVIPATACLVLAGLLAGARIFRNIRSQLSREQRLAGSLSISERRYRELVDQLPHGVVEFDHDGMITYSNPAHYQMLGYQAGELDGRPIASLLPGDAARQGFQESLHDLILEQRPPAPYFARHVTNTGAELSVRVDWDYRRDANREVTGFLAIITDVTEQEIGEIALKESEAKFRMLVESTQDWIWEMDLDGRHTFSNQNGSRILGYSEREFAELGLEDLIHPDDLRDVRERLPDLIASKRGWEIWVVRMRHKDGGYRELESNASPILDADGGVIGYRGIDRDITERLRLEDQLRASLREKETLLQEIHHRVKNNLQVISSLLHFQQKKASAKPERDLLIEAQTRLKAMTLVHELLYRAKSLSKIEMADYLMELADQIQAPYTLSPIEIDLSVEADRLQLPVEQALPVGMIVTELVTNSLKHAFPDGGSGGRIVIRLSAEQARVQVTVTDNGIGLPISVEPDKPADSFGLNLVENLGRQLGGVVSFERGELGTTVSLEFHRDQQPATTR